MVYVDEDMWNEVLLEDERNDPNWVEPCVCGSRECDCDGSEEMEDLKAPQVRGSIQPVRS